MVSKPSNTTNPGRSDPKAFFELGKEQTDAMVGVQKELLDAYEQASRAWLARVKSEVSLWSELATKLASTRSVPEAMQTYQDCVAQRIQMAVDDGQRLSEECQTMMQKLTQSVAIGRPLGGR
jgi:hypothetical protein